MTGDKSRFCTKIWPKIRSRFCSLLLAFCALSQPGCWYTAISRYYDEGSNLGDIYEWRCTVIVAAFSRADKKNFVKERGRPPEEYYDFGLGLYFWTIVEIDTTLSAEERHEIKMDSLKISFKNFSRTFFVKNTFDDNVRDEKYGHVPLGFPQASTHLSLGTVYIPPGIQTVDVAVYGMVRNIKNGLEPFELSRRLTYKERTERISKYD